MKSNQAETFLGVCQGPAASVARRNHLGEDAGSRGGHKQNFVLLL